MTVPVWKKKKWKEENANGNLPIYNISGSACSRHKPKQLRYLQWFDWAEKKTKRGAKQKQCPKCGRWYFREEF